jgi:hypothetical protein
MLLRFRVLLVIMCGGNKSDCLCNVSVLAKFGDCLCNVTAGKVWCCLSCWCRSGFVTLPPVPLQQ